MLPLPAPAAKQSRGGFSLAGGSIPVAPGGIHPGGWQRCYQCCQLLPAAEGIEEKCGCRGAKQPLPQRCCILSGLALLQLLMGSHQVWYVADGGLCQVCKPLVQAAAAGELQQGVAPQRHPAAPGARLQAGNADWLHRRQGPEALPHAPQSWRQLACGAVAVLPDQQPQRRQLLVHLLKQRSRHRCPWPAGLCQRQPHPPGCVAGAHMLLPGQRPKAAAARAASQQLTGEACEAADGGCWRQAAIDELGGDGGELLEGRWRRHASIFCLVQEGADAVGCAADAAPKG